MPFFEAYLEMQPAVECPQMLLDTVGQSCKRPTLSLGTS